MMTLYNKVCHECSKLITKRYSTSFSMGIRCFNKKYRKPIYSIYGFVRFADEIVDTFELGDKESLLSDFRAEAFKAIEEEISLNPVLHAFQQVVNKYGIEKHLIEAFLDSMAMDLTKVTFDQEELDKYIYGSAEVVGLMCLRVFCEDEEYKKLVPYARSLGAAFQKINFLRDIKSDYLDRGRSYFPDLDFNDFDEITKQRIEDDIKTDMSNGYKGITKLPKQVRFGVYLAYVYYTSLFRKLQNAKAKNILEKRIRISNGKKILLLGTSAVRNRLNLL